MKIREEVKELVMRYLLGMASVEDVRRLERILMEDEAVAAYMREAAMQEVALRNALRVSWMVRRRTRVRLFYAVAAVITAAVGVFYMFSLSWRSTGGAVRDGYVATSGAVVCRVLGVGDGSLVSRGGRMESLRLGSGIRCGDTLSTATAVLLGWCGEETRLSLRGGGRVRLLLSPDGGKRIEVERGTLVCDVAPQEKPMIVSAGGVVVKVMGTRFSVGIDDEGFVIVAVAQGDVVVTNRRRTVRLSSGRRCVIKGTVMRVESFGGALSLAPSFRLVDIGTVRELPVKGYDMNDGGDVVGYVGKRPQRAFLWKEGKLMLLGGLGRGMSKAYAVSTTGYVVGEVYSGGRNVAFLWRGGKARLLPSLDAKGDSAALAVNARGDAAGYSTLGRSGWLAVVWRNGEKPQRLPDARALVARDITDDGRVLYHGTKEHPRVCVYVDGRTVSLPVGDCNLAIGNAMNARGEVVGLLGHVGRGDTCATVWMPGGGMLRLGERVDGQSWARDVNDAGWVVGVVVPSGGKGEAYPFLWDGKVMYRLESLVKNIPNEVVLRKAVAVNDRNWILVNGLLKGKRRAFLLVPRESSVGCKEVSHET